MGPVGELPRKERTRVPTTFHHLLIESASAVMDKYRKVIKPKDTAVKDETEIRVTAVGSVAAYCARANTLFNEQDKKTITITGTGNAITKAVTLAEVAKRRFKGLHQITSLSTTEIVDEYEPLEEGLDKVTETKTLSCIEIKLSKEP